MANILVTGGFGFLGSHLIERLLAEPANRVHVVDNLSTNPLPLDFLLDELGHPPHLTYTICSVAEYCRSRVPVYDQIFHLASIVGPAGVIPHMGKIVKSIVDDAYDLIRVALESKARLVDVSTSEVYGGGQEGFCSETMARIVPAKSSARLEYAVGKLAAETALLNTCQVTDLNASIVRPFNISGPRQSGKGGFVLPRFIALALRNMDLTVFGNGQQVRAFTNVKDVVDGIIQVAQAGKRGEAYNVGNPANRCTIDELADAVIRITGSQSSKVYVDPRTIYGPLYEEANDKYPDARKITQELGWRPRYSRDETIQQTANYMCHLPKEIILHLAGDRA
ncbi:MAG TPA: NAD-dependent epimerase/dehydratase family protein [Anaerolineae bacterium]